MLDLSFAPLPGTVPMLRTIMPMSRDGHAFALVRQTAQGVVLSSPLSTGLIGGSENGMPVSYLRGLGTYDPMLPFWVMDLTTHDIAPMNATDVAAADWTPDARQFPLRSVSVFFDPVETGHRFTVHSRLSNGPEMRTSGPARYLGPDSTTLFDVAVLEVAVGEGMEFWVTREADGWSSLGTTGVPWVASEAGMSCSEWNGFGWSAMGMFPDPPQRGPMEMKHFRVHYQNRYSHTFSVRMSDGYLLPP